MKKILIPSLLTLSLSLQAQKPNTEKLEFNYLQYPIVKLDKSWTYTSKVVQKNQNEILEIEKAYVDKLEKIQADYQKAIERYKNYSAAEKLIAGKPTLATVPEPPYTGEVFDEKSVADEYIRIDGFDKVSVGANFTAEIVLNGFQFEGKIQKNKEGKVFFYNVMYKNPVLVRVYDNQGKEYLNETIEASTQNKETPKKIQ